ncbi:MAG: hypothetical protein SGILL_003596 [Bacillariaceae sp.]
MNDIENMTFPTGPVISGVFGANDVMNASDIELQGMLDDIGFFEADEESMLLPITDIKTSVGNGASCVSPPSTEPELPKTNDLSSFSLNTSAVHNLAPIAMPVLVSSHDLILNENNNDATKRMPVTVSSSSVASKVLPKPLAPPSYYLATHKFSLSPPSPTNSQRSVVTASSVASSNPPIAPATAALKALTSKGGATLELAPPKHDTNVKKRRLSDISLHSETYVAGGGEEDEMEMKRERNRLHAKKSRLRKKSLTHTLEESLQALKSENAMLRQSIYQVIGKAKTEAILEKRMLDSHNSFIGQVKSQCVVDKKTATFLRGLKRKMQAVQKKKDKRELLQKQG